ncbi:MAG: tetratricopeptide repeat protein, partial [Gammaproteobacteria bacterium]|nr:tetratricopeptide repeat protein [Gammaproteobacteria bacterium]
MNQRRQGTEPPREHIDRLIALYERRELDDALVHGEALARQFPDSPFVSYLLGVVNAAAGNLERAVYWYTHSLRINPNSAVTHFNLGVTLDRLGRTNEAIASYNESVAIKPDPKAYNNLGACLSELGMAEAAAESFRKALELDPELAEAHNNLGYE